MISIFFHFKLISRRTRLALRAPVNKSSSVRSVVPGAVSVSYPWCPLTRLHPKSYLLLPEPVLVLDLSWVIFTFRVGTCSSYIYVHLMSTPQWWLYTFSVNVTGGQRSFTFSANPILGSVVWVQLAQQQSTCLPCMQLSVQK